ncbi:MAG TPA: toxin-antitoxin system subunit antitoxin [Acidobacteriaceae bacterium]
MEFTVHEAKTQFSKLVASTLAGEEVVITSGRDKKPVARLVKYEEHPARRLGFAPEWPQLSDEALFGPLPPEELAAWEDGGSEDPLTNR